MQDMPMSHSDNKSKSGNYNNNPRRRPVSANRRTL